MDVKKNYIDTARQYSAPAGNAYRGTFELEVAAGILVDSNKATAIAADDVVMLGILPAGLNIHDALMIINDAFAATSTFDIGFEYVDGVDDSNVPQDADYFTSGLAASTLARTRANNTAVAPVTLPKDAYLIVTNKVAAQDTGSKLSVIVEGILTGHP